MTGLIICIYNSIRNITGSINTNRPFYLRRQDRYKERLVMLDFIIGLGLIVVVFLFLLMRENTRDEG